jgi:hypothetical protein
MVKNVSYSIKFIGSSFPKAKPKHGLFTVARQALLRFIFLPLYHNWWSAQTSSRLFGVFLSLYAAQVFNILLYLNILPSSPLAAYEDVVNASSATLKIIPSQEEPIYGPPNFNQANGSIFISEIQTSEILSPVVLMIVLTILHSQIVATHGSTSGIVGGEKSSGHKQRRNSASGIHGKPKSKRKVPRHSLRRRSNPKSNSSSHLLPRLDIANQQQEPCIAPGSKKVFFEDESKSWTSSNSEKDEGIVDEIGQENVESGENENVLPGCFRNTSRKNSQDLREFVDKNIIEANITATIRKFTEEEANSIKQQQILSEPHVSRKEDLESDLLPESQYKLRSNLRKRNISKVSEVSTTSCADCSSNNNDSSSEDEFREATMEDDELRSKSEWTAVTTNSEDDDYEEENIHSEDEDEMTENQLHDHPFAWEFQKVVEIITRFKLENLKQMPNIYFSIHSRLIAQVVLLLIKSVAQYGTGRTR